MAAGQRGVGKVSRIVLPRISMFEAVELTSTPARKAVGKPRFWPGLVIVLFVTFTLSKDRLPGSGRPIATPAAGESSMVLPSIATPATPPRLCRPIPAEL